MFLSPVELEARLVFVDLIGQPLSRLSLDFVRRMDQRRRLRRADRRDYTLRDGGTYRIIAPFPRFSHCQRRHRTGAPSGPASARSGRVKGDHRSGRRRSGVGVGAAA